jgi:hypothetical protein
MEAEYTRGGQRGIKKIRLDRRDTTIRTVGEKHLKATMYFRGQMAKAMQKWWYILCDSKKDMAQGLGSKAQGEVGICVAAMGMSNN